MRRIVDAEHTEKPQYPAWSDDVELKSHLTLGRICTYRFCGDLDPAGIIMGAVKRMESYYKSGIERGNIKEYEGWFFMKCLTAARDERQHLLGRPRDKEKRKIFVSTDKHVGEPGGEVSGKERGRRLSDLLQGPPTPEAENMDLLCKILESYEQESPIGKVSSSVILLEVYGHSVEDLASQLEVPPANVKNMLRHDAREMRISAIRNFGVRGIDL